MMETRRDVKITNVDAGLIGSNPANVKDLARDPRYKFVKGNLANHTFTNRVLRNADMVVNFAAQTHVDRSISGPAPFFESNAKAAFNVFQSAKDNKLGRLVHISTDEVYGSIKSGSFSEKDVLSPSSPYSGTKAAADMMAHAWSKTYNLPLIVLRCTNNFGPRQHPEKFIPKTIIRALRGMDIPLYGGGEQVRDWIYVGDFCSAIEAALERGSPGETYNISGGNELPNEQVAQEILHKIGSASKTVVVEDRPGHDYRYSLDSTKARENLGWSPAESFQQGLGLTIEWYRKNEEWWKPLATPKVLSATPWKEKW